MFRLFIEFLCSILNNLEVHLTQGDTCSDEVLAQIYDIYTLFKRLDRRASHFARVLQVWQNDFYHGSSWSGAHSQLETMHKIMSLLNEDLYGLIHLLNPNADPETGKVLRYELLGHPYLAKSDTFEIWQRILARNARQRFCSWISLYSETSGKTLDAFGEIKFFPDVEKRLIFVPYHSFLLLDVKRTCELEDLSKSQWKQDIDALNYSPKLQVDWYPEILRFLPEFPPSFAIKDGHVPHLAEQSYSLRLEVPDQQEIITDIIASIEQEATILNQAVSQLQQSLKSRLNNSLDLIL